MEGGGGGNISHELLLSSFVYLINEVHVSVNARYLTIADSPSFYFRIMKEEKIGFMKPLCKKTGNLMRRLMALSILEVVNFNFTN